MQATRYFESFVREQTALAVHRSNAESVGRPTWNDVNEVLQCDVPHSEVQTAYAARAAHFRNAGVDENAIFKRRSQQINAARVPLKHTNFVPAIGEKHFVVALLVGVGAKDSVARRKPLVVHHGTSASCAGAVLLCCAVVSFQPAGAARRQPALPAKRCAFSPIYPRPALIELFSVTVKNADSHQPHTTHHPPR